MVASKDDYAAVRVRAPLHQSCTRTGEVRLAQVPPTRRAEGELPGTLKRSVDGDWNVDAGVTNVGVVEDVVDPGCGRVGIKEPAAKRYLDAELAFFVALAVEGDEVSCWPERTARWAPWRLLEVAIEPLEDPIQPGNSNGDSEPRGRFHSR